MVKILQLMARLLALVVPLFGVDKHLFTTIVSTKLTTDFRRSVSNGFKTKKSKNTFGRQLIAFLFISLIFGKSLFEIPHPEVAFLMLFFMLLVLTSMTLLTEFTTVLFNEDENSIFLPRPISSKTLLVSRLGHITLYILAIVLSFSILPAIFSAIKYGIVTGIVFLIAAILNGWVALLLTIFFYSILSKFVSGEKFKDVLSYVQIGVAMAIFLVYQLVLDSGGSSSIVTAGLPDVWWMYLLIPTWFTKLSLVAIAPPDLWTWVSLGLIIVTCFWGAKSIINLLSEKFYDILSSVSSGAGNSMTYTKELDGKWSLRRFFCISSLENAGWKLSATSTKRDRQFKQSILPLLGYGFVFIIVFIVKEAEGGFAQTLANMKDSYGYFYFLLPMLFLTTPLSYLRYTKSADAGWVYHLIPEDKQYHILTGAIKACITRFFMPPLLILSIAIVLIWGVELLPAFLLGSGITLFVALASELFNRALPLSLGYDQISKGATSIRMMLLMLVNGLAFGAVYFLVKIHVGFTLGILAFVILFIVLMMRALREK